MDQGKQAGESIVTPISATLQKVDPRMTEIDKARPGANGARAEQLNALNIAQLHLQSAAARLATAKRSTPYPQSLRHN